MPVSEIRSTQLPDAEWWESLLQQWGAVMDKYCNLFPDDAPYWYGERSLTGLLAAASWMLPDGWSLEEFVAPRDWGGEPSSGRGDVWIGRSDTWFTLECKCAWVYSTQLDTAVQAVRQRLGEAKEQLDSLHKDYCGEYQLAVCYVVPDLVAGSPEASPDSVQVFFDGFVTYFQNNALIAVYRPPDRARTYASRCYPGVLLVGELFHSST